MRILLLGGNGQVGTELRRSLASLGKVVVATRNGLLADGSACEIADFDRPEGLPALVDRVAPDVVVNAAAYTAVDRAETEPEAALRANAMAPAAIAAACASRDALLVHYSTDYVFDGTSTQPYREEDPTSPLGVYGASKLAGEVAIRDSGARHMIFRTSWVYAAHGRNFLLTMLRLAAERDELRVVADQVGSPTSAAHIADATAAILAQHARSGGLWHLTCTGQTSWHGFAEAIMAGAVERGLLDKAPRVLPISTSDYPTPAARPAFSVLDNGRLQSDFGLHGPDWRDALTQVLDTLAGDVES
ncbi:dTDP-4-dehydrorhamnose reductase [Luteimonas sp. 22616]|uniref:dTDP-4-dehydrorhamnose reductase n=1 Tax=Luteimonas sp. 22616 TaxID=3453951 RepID=UPI003F8613B8